MPRPVRIGPLALWARNGSYGDILVCEYAGERVEYPRSMRTARADLAWRAYRDRSHAAAVTYPYAPRG